MPLGEGEAPPYPLGMRRAFLLALAAIPLAAAARASTTAGSLDAAKISGKFAAVSATHEGARTESGAIFDGTRSEAGVVRADGESTLHKNNLYAAPGVSHSGPTAPPGPQMPASAASKKWPPWAMYGAGAGLGFLQGALFGGLLGGIGGAAIGLATSHFYMNDKPEVSLGISAGSIVGGFLGGPIGALAGAVIGGLVGWLVGKLF
ncbi:MAG: Uncharacterized protein FD126_1542 [Elusimicrobia bacterium]|nr:MAG: Uncharacterized protein FD126_1542 [Elusimicrobiota bacterium]